MQPNLRVVPSRADSQAYLDWEQFNRNEARAIMNYPDWKAIGEWLQVEEDRKAAREELRVAMAQKKRRNERREAAIGCMIFAGIVLSGCVPWMVGIVNICEWAWTRMGGGR